MSSSSSDSGEQELLHESTTSTWTWFGLQWRRLWVSMLPGGLITDAREQQQHQSSTSPSSSAEESHSPVFGGVSDPYPTEERGKEQIPELGPFQLQDGPSFARSAVQTENEGMVTTTIRSTDVALGPRDEAAGTEARASLHEAIELSHAESRDQSSIEDSILRITEEDLGILGAWLLQRFNRFGDLADLQQAITNLKAVVKSTAISSYQHRTGLGNLGVALLHRFRHLGEPGDLEDAISTLRSTVDLIPHGHPDKPTYLTSLGTSSVIRFGQNGKLSDLEDGISKLRDAVDLTPHGHPHKPACLNNLGNVFITRFERLGELKDLEAAISVLRDAVQITPEPACLSNLGSAFRSRFERLGELGDLEDAMSMLRGAVELTPDEDPDKPGRLANLATCFQTRFERFGEACDLENTILTLRSAIDLTPHGYPDYPGRLVSIGTSLFIRFKRLGKSSDLEDAISMFRDAVDLTPDGHYHKPGYLSNLGGSLTALFGRLGGLSDLEDAIAIQRDAVNLTPHDHPDKPACLNSLGNSLLTRYGHLGELRDLEDAVLMLRDAVNLTPDGHPCKPRRLQNLGNSLVTRFKRHGEPRDLEDAILTLRDVNGVIPRSHLDKPGALDALGNALETHFQHFGELSHLEDAISMHRDAVDITPHDHFEKPAFLNALASSLRIRFEHLGELNDIEDAVLMLRDAVGLSPDGHACKLHRLVSLGTSLFTRFERLGDLEDLEEAISKLRDAVDLIPDGHLENRVCLNNLGSSLLTRFQHSGELSDLEDAIPRFRNVVDLTPDGHIQKPAYLSNLGGSLITRFECLGELRDISDAISILGAAVTLTPDSHPRKPIYLNNLGTSFAARFDLLGELRDLEAAIFIYFQAASASFGPVKVRFQASLKWISCARRIHHQSLLHAYSVAINLLPQLAWIGLSLTSRYSELARGADVVREAAAAALDLGFPETAVEWLEQGRSIVWGELFQLRNSYEELSSGHPDYSRRLRELSAALEHAGATREKSLSTLSEKTRGTAYGETGSLAQEANKHRALALERDKLLQEIRRLPGFEQFLLRKEFSQLRASAHAGPVVMLNATDTRCDALIVLANVDHVVHVPLPNFTFTRSADLQNTLRSFLRQGRESRSARWDGTSWELFLSPLWEFVVKPVLDALAFSTPGDLSRIFWCPTGPFVFLPVHAAGLYDTQNSKPGNKVFDFVVSSYAPTLSILAPLSNPSTAPTEDFRLLAVRQPTSDGLPPLKGVNTELEYIREVVRDSPSAETILQESALGTVEEVLALMKEADWVHFACHGVQDASNPTRSGLCLADQRRLKISDIIALSRSRGGLAFLSACQTATGDQNLSDEAIHIAAAMLFAGYKGVIGTMWSISDQLAPDVAKDVYEQLLGKGRRPDYREAARALHDAIGRVRESRSASFDEWVPFIHVGL